jgi:hypothetical protein
MSQVPPPPELLLRPKRSSAEADSQRGNYDHRREDGAAKCDPAIL